MRTISSFVFAVLCVTSVCASDWDARLGRAVAELDARDFEIRERASMALEEFPPEYVEKFLDLSEELRDRPEVSARLRRGARALFMKKVLTKDSRYLRLFGQLGFYCETQYSEYNSRDYGDGDLVWYPAAGSESVGKRIDAVYGPEVGLKKWDVIVKVDGEDYDEFFRHDYSSWGLVEMGREYEFTVRRYRNIRDIESRNAIIQTDEYDVVKVRVKAMTKKSEFVDHGELRRLMSTAWRDFLADRESRLSTESATSAD